MEAILRTQKKLSLKCCKSCPLFLDMFFTMAVLGSYSESVEIFSTSEPLGSVWARRNSPLEWITAREQSS
jgi:hypothetical protein